MANTCLDTNLSNYSGTSQVQRALNALDVKFAQVDERSDADLVLFAKKYGFYLNYYDLTNNINGDWQGLMEKDAAVGIAYIADWQTKDYNPFIEYLLESVKAATGDADAQKFFKFYFDFIFSLAKAVDTTNVHLPDDIGFKAYLSVAISSNLALPLNTLVQYYAAFTPGLVDDTLTFKDDRMPVDTVVLSQHFKLNSLSKAWKLSVPVTAQTISLTGATVAENINQVVTHNLFTGVLQAFINGIVNIVSQAPAYLETVMKNYASHFPHYAMFLTFLRLFRSAQDNLNNYTKRHLDFYYKQVLELTNNAAEPDFVHLLFELQKNVEDRILVKGTTFKAGKDDNNNDIFYALTDDVVLRQSAVQSLKSLYLTNDVETELYASPVANSEDGNGAKLISPDKSWMPFGDVNKISQATIGFAIASNVLFLNEGKRTVTLTFQCNDATNITSTDFEGKCTMQFTGKKGLYDPSAFDPVNGKLKFSAISSTSFSLSAVIPGNAPAIVPYSSKIHGGNFIVALPMVQVTLTDYSGYSAIKSLVISAVTVDVSADNVKDLSLQNDDGKINPAKPFKPFGEFPEEDASFIIGSKEIFQKPLTSLTLNTNWQTQPSPAADADALALIAGEWPSVFDYGVSLNASTISLSSLAGIPVSPPDFSGNEDYKVTSVDGFIKLQLASDKFNLSTYLSGVQTALAASTVSSTYDDSTKKTTYTVGSPPVVSPPATPVIKSFSISYAARETIFFSENSTALFNGRTNFYYHIEPFGYREVHPFITADALSFLPVFNVKDVVSGDDGGELWIGLNNAGADSTYSLLFQVADGTANPLENMTEVDWYYLSGNNWIKFDDLSITDDTNNLTRSGIVVVKVPAAATLDNTRAEAGLLWVKLVVGSRTDAVCKLVAVSANAAKATFLQDVTKSIYYTKPLAANIISKPAVADAAIKKTLQPYGSFGGRIKETDSEFYVRVSERLRHKHRAVTTWDYERMVLQYFPQVHKVKCINHTGLVTKEGSTQQKYSEVLPGHVTVVTVPDLANHTTVNVLRPYTSIGLLTDIYNYLIKLTSPFVQLHVINPQFEEVQFDFSVTFTGILDPTVFRQQLNEDIQQFLTPWAYDTAKDIEFGGKIEKSVVLNFIEERYYVDFVTCFKMNHIISRTDNTITEALYDVEEAIASTARSILVSYYNEVTGQKHIISSPANCECNA
ncbi:MAG TPA: hypothetical protein VG738_09770 [Chitinophagaceae bacterium]|nr:hypothetical protein [Chitinophagaceae bacterium]